MTECLRKIDECGEEGLLQATPSNNEHFNRILNNCRHPRRVYAALLAFVEPSIKQSDDMTKEHQILFGDLLTRLDVAECYK